VRVAPTNLFFKAGEKSLDELTADVGEGLVITDLAGLHSGANAISGDFSLLSKGYTIEGGKRGRAVEQITIAGNFYEVLKSIVAFASSLRFGDFTYSSHTSANGRRRSPSPSGARNRWRNRSALFLSLVRVERE
jgi:predicted Zn-dependent protease